jgi:hypothetical protein
LRLERALSRLFELGRSSPYGVVEDSEGLSHFERRGSFCGDERWPERSTGDLGVEDREACI